jgi:hypothetical protein
MSPAEATACRVGSILVHATVSKLTQAAFLVSCGSWLCKNAVAREGNRIDVFLGRLLVAAEFISVLDFAGLRKTILVVSRVAEFLHSLGQNRPSDAIRSISA